MPEEEELIGTPQETGASEDAEPVVIEDDTIVFDGTEDDEDQEPDEEPEEDAEPGDEAEAVG